MVGIGKQRVLFLFVSLNFLVFLPDFFLRFFDRYAVLRLMELLDLLLQNVYLNLAIFLLTVELHRLGSDFLQNLFYLVVLVGQFFDFGVTEPQICENCMPRF